MNISGRTKQRLREHINGDEHQGKYRSGPDLVMLFNEFISNDSYGQGFPSRWQYTEQKLDELNGNCELIKLIETVFDPLEYEKDHSLALGDINSYLCRDGYQLQLSNNGVKLFNISSGVIVSSISDESNPLTNQFIIENVDKCNRKLGEADYSGVITNARSLVEDVLYAIEGHFSTKQDRYDGNLPKLHKRVVHLLNLSDEHSSVIETLRGFSTIINGLSSLSNEMADRHGGSLWKPTKDHAILSINVAQSLCSFLLALAVKQM